MKTLLVYLWRIWFVFLGIFLGILVGFWIYIFSINPRHYCISYRLMRLWCVGMFYGMGFRYDLIKETQRNIDSNQQYIIIANHTSVVDIFLMCILHKHHPICFVGKKELEKIPIFGTIFKRVAVSVDRKDPQSRAEVYTHCAERIREGKSVVIFPEGGVTDDLSVVLQDFRNGAFSMAVQHQFEILVYTFIDLKYMFPFDNSKGYPGRVKVYFNDILPPDTDMERLKNKAWTMIHQTLIKHNNNEK